MERFGTVSIVKKISFKSTDKLVSVLSSNPFRKFVNTYLKHKFSTQNRTPIVRIRTVTEKIFT